VFHDIFEVVRDYLPNGELVDLHDNYDDCICYISEDGLQGFAIEKGGNLVSVFNLSDKRGFLDTIRDYVLQQGATHLDAYASKNQNLQEIYTKTLGWQTASVMDYNMDYDHDDIAANHGNPNVVFMVAPSQAKTQQRHFGKDDYDAAVAHQQSQIKSATDNNGNFSTQDDNIYYSRQLDDTIQKLVIGEQGAAAVDKAQEATRRIDNLAVAKQMEEEGKDALTIKQATGWERVLIINGGMKSNQL